ncbi:MAG: hypothetical protein MJ085_01565 [Clostridia bacterium]|nr:hypothetical protein [Clostridia bacterium]
MNFELKTLSNGILVAELFHGKTGTAEDYTGSDIPGGYLRVIDAVYESLVRAGVIASGEAADFAAPTSLWISACLQAKIAGTPIGRVICPFSTLPWNDEALYLFGVTADEASEWNQALLQAKSDPLAPRAAAAALAAKHFREETESTRPLVVLATQSPEKS